jgi:phenylpyruvate tautomerase PptA (4-oxalocrotonate tautomerase family)
MRPPVIKVRVPENAKREEITKAVNAKLTRKATDLLRKNQEVILSIFAFERARRAGAKKTGKS